MKILNFGSLNLDLIYEVEHLVLPGETISAKRHSITAGGKGLNQSIALAKAGVTPFHAGAIGEADSEMLLGILQGNGINTDLVNVMEEASGHAIIQVDQEGQNSIIIYGGTNQRIDEEFVNIVLSNFNKGDVILLQNEISSTAYIMEQAYKKGLKIYFNPSPITSELFDYPLDYIDTLILNEIEGKQLTGFTDREEIIKALGDRYPETKLVLTLGEAGVIYSHKDVREYQGIYKNPVVDTTAAGDTFTGYFIASIAKGMGIKDGLKYASAAAAMAISKLGAATSIPTLKEVEVFINSYL